MSAILAAFAAAALAAVPPSLGSEPDVVGFDHRAPATPEASVGAASYTASLGSEPFVLGLGEITYPAAERPDASGREAATYADALGSGPSVVGLDGALDSPARAADTRLACACPCH